MADPFASNDDAAERETIAQLADSVLPQLIARLTASHLGELEVRENGWRIRLRRPVSAEAETVSRTPHPVMAQPPLTAHAAGRDGAREPMPGVVASPAVGYFTPRQGIEAGSQLRSGDPIGEVDVLGVRHEVVASVSGSLRGFEVEPGEAVEFGQLIARVEADV